MNEHTCTTADTLDETCCLGCEIGSYQETWEGSHNNEENCQECEAGKFAGATGKSECDDCPEGKTSRSGAWTCEDEDVLDTSSLFQEDQIVDEITR